MKFVLTEKPKDVTIIQGFPSLALVSTISIKYILDHLDVKEIGHIESKNLLPLTAIHKGQIVNPITLYYNKKHNLVLVQSLSEVGGFEWDLAETMHDIARELKAKEIVTIEGMPPHEKNKVNLFYYSEKKKIPKLKPLQEGIVMGVTAALLLKCRGKIDVTSFFAEAHSQLPDSEAAAQVVDGLNTYLGLDVDYKPLMETAKKFEHNLKQFIEKTKQTIKQEKPKADSGEVSYIG